jgi:hypothetical protein
MKKSHLSMLIGLTLVSSLSFASRVVKDHLLQVEPGNFPKLVVKNASNLNTSFDLSYAFNDGRWVIDGQGNVISDYENSSKMGVKGVPAVLGEKLLGRAKDTYLLDTLTFHADKSCTIDLMENGWIQLFVNRTKDDVILIDAKACTAAVA